MKVRSFHSVEKLEQLLLLRVLSGEFAGADTLPSRTELAATYGVCSNTVGAAIGRLIARGVCASRTGVGILPIPLVHALDHKLLLELIKQAEDLAQAMRLLEQVMTLVRELVVKAASVAAARRDAAHVRALQELTEEVSLLHEGGLAAARSSAHEYNVWRIISGASGNLALTAVLNGLRPIWLDATVMRGRTHDPPLELILHVAQEVMAGNAKSARLAADRLAGARLNAIRAARHILDTAPVNDPVGTPAG